MTVSTRAPLRYALLLAAGYIVVGGSYIAVSGRLAASEAREVEDLAAVELTKGVVFVATTGLLLFGGAAILLRRLQRSTVESTRSREALVAADRKAQAGVLAAALAHDLRNLLSVLVGGIHELSAQDALSGENSATLSDMSAAAAQCTELVKQLSRARSAARVETTDEVDVAASIGRTVSFLRHHERARKAASLIYDVQGNPMINGNSLLIEQLTTNLVVNALEAAGDRATVRVVVIDEQGSAVLEVHDNGPGIPPEQRQEIFKPFVTSKETGIGLGLLSARMAAEAHGGTIEVDASSDGGACFRARLRSMPARRNTTSGEFIRARKRRRRALRPTAQPLDPTQVAGARFFAAS